MRIPFLPSSYREKSTPFVSPTQALYSQKRRISALREGYGRCGGRVAHRRIASRKARL